MVVLLSPILDPPASTSQVVKPVIVETFISGTLVEALDERILIRLAWVDEMPANPILVSQLSKARPVNSRIESEEVEWPLPNNTPA